MGDVVRWDEFFADLESQWDAEHRRELDAEVADRTRRERATVSLHERLAGAGDHVLTLALRDGSRVVGRALDVGAGWVLVEGAGPASAAPALVPFEALVAVTGLPTRAAGSMTGRRFGLGYALRGLSRDRSVVAITDLTGAVLTGTIDGVGADSLELAEHAADVPRRPENVTGRRLVPFSAVVVVRPV